MRFISNICFYFDAAHTRIQWLRSYENKNSEKQHVGMWANIKISNIKQMDEMYFVSIVFCISMELRFVFITQCYQANDSRKYINQNANHQNEYLNRFLLI